MHPKRAFVALVAATVVAGTVATTSLAQATERQPGRDTARWVDTWTSMQQLVEPGNLPPAPFTSTDAVMVDTTLRQTIHVSLGGETLRIHVSNAFGGSDLPITRAVIARPAGGQAGVSAVDAGSTRSLTFSGRTSVTVPVGAEMVSDPVDRTVAAQSNVSVTLYLAQGQATTSVSGHPGSRTTSYIVKGDHASDADLPGATHVDHWYFLSSAEVIARQSAAAVDVLGDSLTDGRGSTTNANNRWPDQLLAGLQQRRATGDVGVLNEAAGGNRVLHEGLGPNLMSRLDRDVFALDGVRWVLVFEGVNDIGTADATPQAQTQVGDDLIMAIDQLITRAHAHDLRVYGATITPFGGNTSYDDAAGLREATRSRVNDWIRTGGRFDAVVDFDRAVADPAAPRQLLAAYDVGDHLHMNPTGYGVLAATVPPSLFQTGRS